MGAVCQIGADIAKNSFPTQGAGKQGKDLFNEEAETNCRVALFRKRPAKRTGPYREVVRADRY
jgi:hypothetical protein